MVKYNLANLAGGWTAFFVAAAVYISTVEPTTSFWDCGEFITSAYKLQIGHPPGAPFFMLIGRLFTLFAGNPANVAISINIMSALASAFTIMFLFLTITHLAKKIVITPGKYTTAGIITVMGAGFTGAMAYTFSDTFWFSAVEAEVYALSSLFTAVVFWAILKWEESAGEKYANRWLILIAYLMGLSIGVHLLNLLAIPAIVFVFYFKNYAPTLKSFLYAAAISVLLLGTVMYGIIQGFVVLASYFELFFVNSMGLPFKSGVIVYLALTGFLLVTGLAYTRRKQMPLQHTILLGITVILIGYSSFSLIIIRSLADPPMNQNNPSNLFSLQSYLNREQYGDRPLFHGPWYNAPVTGDRELRPAYIQQNEKYIPAKQSFDYLYDSRFKTLFPRMYSSGSDHIEAYKEWGRVEGKEVMVTNTEGKTEIIVKPTFRENLRFFFRYQLGHMYGRYFMWNFAGRQNDLQGHGRILEGNWLSGIHFLDEMRLGPRYGMPGHLEKNKARNKYYMLPLLLGILGLLTQINKDKKGAWVIFLLFFFTGIAIVLYLNQTPYQPRERDYAYAGSFYAFSVWIGLGVLAVYDNLKKYAGGTTGAVLSSLIPLLAVPGVMAVQNWDDHDRSGRYIAADMGRNYLQSCAPGAILFTYGDNDTFPLWYAQEVEGVRTDVRVVNLSYLSADWYIDQMKKKAYESEPLPLSMSHDKYVQGTRDIIYLVDRMQTPADLKAVIDFVLDDDIRTRIQVSAAEYVDYIPSKRFTMAVDPSQVIRTGTVRPEFAHLIEPVIEWEINRNYITKSGLAIFDILAGNNWERPIYFAVTVPSTEYLGLQDYFQLEGLAYRLVPIKKDDDAPFTGRVNTDIMYSNLTEKFRWGNINDPEVYLDETTLRLASGLRINFARLAGSLIEEGQKSRAVEVLDKAMEIMPHETVPYNYFIIPLIENYYLAGEAEKASAIARQKTELLVTGLNYYLSFKRSLAEYVEFERNRALSLLNELLKVVTGNDPELETEINGYLESYYRFLSDK